MLQQPNEASLIIIRKRSGEARQYIHIAYLTGLFLIGETVRKRRRPSRSWSSRSACSVDSSRRVRVRRSWTSSEEGCFVTIFSTLRSLRKPFASLS
jgi:hypothetical protein